MFRVVLSVLFFLYIVQVDSAVLGIDFGSEFTKVGIVAPQYHFKIALDISSKRKSPNIVGFDNGERRFGNEAKTLVTRKPTSTYKHLTKLLGKSIDNSEILGEYAEQYYPYEFFEDEARNTVRVKFDEETSFSIEEVVSMYLRHARSVAEGYMLSTSPVRDCVITVPEFWSTKERRALLDAADLAGLNVLGLINENSAAALYYGVEMDYNVNKTETFIFYNMGSQSTQASVVEYSAYLKKVKRVNKTMGQLNIKSVAWDESLGGNNFDTVLVENMRAKAEEQLKDVLDEPLATNFRSMSRLREACVKAKQILGGNKDTTVRITSLYKDEDFKGFITRDEFYESAQPLLDRVYGPLDEALERAGMTKDDIDGIVLMGGGTRIPKIKEMLHDYLNKELRKDLNTDEAAAMGATFYGANQSVVFRVRQIGFTDQSSLSLRATVNNFADYEEYLLDPTICLEEATFQKSATIFNQGTRLEKRKSISFKHDQELYVTMNHGEDDPLPRGTDKFIDHYNVSGITSAIVNYAEKNVTDHKPTVKLSFQLQADGIFRLSRAQAIFHEWVEVKKPRIVTLNTTVTAEAEEEKEEPSTPETAGDEPVAESEEESAEREQTTGEESESENTEESGEQKDDADTETEEQTDDSETNAEGASEGAESEGEESTEVEEETVTTTPPPIIEYDIEWVKQERKVALKIRSLQHGVKSMSKEDKRVSDKVLLELDEADQAIRDTAEAFNNLEAYILEHRTPLYEDEDEYIMAVSEEETREEMIELLTETEDWLYDEEDPSSGKFKAKLREIRNQVDPIFSRAYEYHVRTELVAKTGEYLVYLKASILNMTESMPWLPADELEGLVNNTRDFDVWFNGKVEDQSTRELTEKPAFTEKQIRDRVQKLSDDLILLSKRPKPKEKPKKRKKRKKSNETDTTDSGNGTTTAGEEKEEDPTDAFSAEQEASSSSEEEETEETEDNMEPEVVEEEEITTTQTATTGKEEI